MQRQLNKIELLDFINATSSALAVINENGEVLCSNNEFKNLFPKNTRFNNIVDIIDEFNKAEKDNLLNSLNKNVQKFIVQSSSAKENSITLSICCISQTRDGLFFLCTASVEYKKDDSNLLQQLINTIPDSIYIKDTRSRFVLANKGVAKGLNANSPEELIGKDDFHFHAEHNAKQYKKDEERIIQTGKPIINKHEQVKKSGKTYWYSTTKAPLFDNSGNIKGIVGISRDITSSKNRTIALKKAKIEAEQADILKSTFLANLSHEIRTPLNGIIGFSQFIKQKKPKDEKRDKYLDIIYNNGQQLLMLINDIIDISMIDSNQVKPEMGFFRINPVIGQLKENFEYQITTRKLPVTIKCVTDLPDGEDKINTDDRLVVQILDNLLQNAVKFTKTGEISFGYKLKNDLLEFYVKDTGIGISKSKQKEIFNRFRQGDESSTRTYSGTGLGLAISKGLVELLGGRITVSSKENVGSAFYFTVPSAIK